MTSTFPTTRLFGLVDTNGVKANKMFEMWWYLWISDINILYLSPKTLTAKFQSRDFLFWTLNYDSFSLTVSLPYTTTCSFTCSGTHEGHGVNTVMTSKQNHPICLQMHRKLCFIWNVLCTVLSSECFTFLSLQLSLKQVIVCSCLWLLYTHPTLFSVAWQTSFKAWLFSLQLSKIS